MTDNLKVGDKLPFKYRGEPSPRAELEVTHLTSKRIHTEYFGTFCRENGSALSKPYRGCRLVLPELSA